VSGLALLLMVRVEATGVFHLGVQDARFGNQPLSTNSHEYRKTSSLTEKGWTAGDGGSCGHQVRKNLRLEGPSNRGKL